MASQHRYLTPGFFSLRDNMDFKDHIKVLSEKVLSLKDKILTEEATKNAFVMPFIQILGYDIFNPTEVVPELVVDYGAKNVEKVDYAIMKDNQPVMIMECKWHGESLEKHYTQLHKYFHMTKARFGILTNGVVYWFYTDLENPNKMDEKPFLSFDISNIKEQTIVELKKFHKSAFDIGTILTTASELKYSNEIRTILINELNNPSVNFVKFFLRQVYSGQATEKALSIFTEIVKKSSSQLISDLISDRLKTALENEVKIRTEATNATVQKLEE
jgi:predicted type IV restriction endonuclease